MSEGAGSVDFRVASNSKATPKAVADGVAGMLMAAVDLRASPDRVFNAIMTRDVERWWMLPGVYCLRDWKVELKPKGRWSVVVALHDDRTFSEWGEICAVDAPRSVVMTRRFSSNPLLEERETTLTYRLEASTIGARLTLREEGFVGRPEAAFGNAENWEKVLGWLDAHLSAAP